MEKKVLGDKIVVYSNISEDPMAIIRQAEEITAKYPRVGFKQATINNHQYDTSLRSCTVFSLFPDKSDKSIVGIESRAEKVRLNQKIISQTSMALLDFIKEYGFTITERESWELLSYEETQKLTWHSDNGDPHPCLVSMVYYLNDDYEGGELYFPQHNGFEIKPKKGTMLIFSGTIDNMHGIKEVTEGTRYTHVTFWSNNISKSSKIAFDKKINRLLIDKNNK